VYGRDGVATAARSKTFVVADGMARSLIVVLSEDAFAVAGIVVQRRPTASGVAVEFDSDTGMLRAQYELCSTATRATVSWIRTEPGRQPQVVTLGRCRQVAPEDGGCAYRINVVPASCDGDVGEAVTSPPVAVEEAWLPLTDAELVQFEMPEAVVEGVPVVIAFPRSRQIEMRDVALVRVDRPIPRRCDFGWTCNGARIASDAPDCRCFTPRKAHIGKTLAIELRDRIRDRTVAVHKLPVVIAARPTVTGVELALDCSNETTGVYTVKVVGQYSGGIEGESRITWYSEKQPPPFSESRKTSQKPERNVIDKATGKSWIFEAESRDTYISVDYTPVREDGEEGTPVHAGPIRIPAVATVEASEARIVLNANCTELSCILKQGGAGWLSYSWAHSVDGEFTRLGNKNTLHEITAADLKNNLCCVLDGLDETGKRKKRAIVPIHPPLCEQLTPKINSARIVPVNRGKDEIPSHASSDLIRRDVVGREQEVILDYRGPRKTTVVTWFRKTEDGLQEIFEGQKYTRPYTDCGHEVSAKVTVTARASFDRTLLYTLEEMTNPILVNIEDPLLVRFASAMKRAGKGQFDAVLFTGEAAILMIENKEGRTQLSIRLGRTVMHTSEIQDIKVEPCEGETGSVIVHGTHRYRTELSITAKKTSVKQEFSPTQARDLFILAVQAFQSSSAEPRTTARKNATRL
jgi:hypothetical protein